MMMVPSQPSRQEKMERILNLLETLPSEMVETLLENWWQMVLAEGWFHRAEDDPLQSEMLTIEAQKKDV